MKGTIRDPPFLLNAQRYRIQARSFSSYSAHAKPVKRNTVARRKLLYKVDSSLTSCPHAAERGTLRGSMRGAVALLLSFCTFAVHAANESSTPAARWMYLAKNGVRAQPTASKDPDGGALAFMGGPCDLLYAAGASVRRGLLVELGTWAGGSMRCFLAGLNTTGKHGRAHGFDYFEASQEYKLKGTKFYQMSVDSKMANKYDILPVFYWQTQDLYPSVNAHRGNWRADGALLKALGNETIVDVFSDDMTKVAEELVIDLSLVAHQLRPGSLILLADWLQQASDYANGRSAHSDVVLFSFYALIIPKKIELVGAVMPYGFFRVLEPFDGQYLRTRFEDWKRIALSPASSSQSGGDPNSCQHVEAEARRSLFEPCTATSCIGLPLGGTTSLVVEGGKRLTYLFPLRRGLSKCRGRNVHTAELYRLH